MLQITGTPDCRVTINDVNVTYSQHLATDLLRETTWDDLSVINIGSVNALVIIDSLVVTAEISCMTEIFVNAGFDALMFVNLPYCNSPVPFLINQVC